jgi:hypothetical protein
MMHNLRTPLTSLSLSAAMLKDGYIRREDHIVELPGEHVTELLGGVGILKVA